MFLSKLIALKHPNPELLNLEDPKQFRATVLWLEDQKIRHRKIEDRADLRNFLDKPNEWMDEYNVYKRELGMPTILKSPTEELAWIIGYAIRLEYYDDAEKYKLTSEKFLQDKSSAQMPSMKSTNAFDDLDFASDEFISGVRDLASKLEIPYHPDHITQLKAICHLVTAQLNTEVLKEPVLKNVGGSIEELLGQDYNSDNLNFASRILRLLQIQSIRRLQTTINETIVAVQNITADPKTDTKLGQVGF